MKPLRIFIDLPKITYNSQQVKKRCRSSDIEIVGVTKGVWGSPEIAQAILDGGIKMLGDSRLENIHRMRLSGIQSPIMLLRSPTLEEVNECITLSDISLISDLNVIESVSVIAHRRNRRHEIILMVDVDTGREGLVPDSVLSVCRHILTLPGIQLKGLGMYFSDIDEPENCVAAQYLLVELADQMKKEFGCDMSILSGGSSNVFQTVALAGKKVSGINQLRIGTAILLGISRSSPKQPIPELYQDTFILESEVIEIKNDRSCRAILPVGKLDVDPDHVWPDKKGIKLETTTSDHMLINYANSPTQLKTGDKVQFRLGYHALSRLMASPSVRKIYKTTNS